MERSHMMKEVLDWLKHIALAVIITLVIVNFIGQFTIVQGDSMLPTLENNDILIIEKLTQRLGAIRQGDIVVVKIPEFLEDGKTYAVKRILATEGQRVGIREGKVFVDGEELHETYINGSETQIAAGLHDDLTVPEGTVYILGDNRLPGESKDSRTFGPVSVKRIAGRVVFRLFPFRGLGLVK
jgi:signal peptidase I